MFFRFKFKGWEKVDCHTYHTAYQAFGGSFITHHEVLADFAELTGVTPTYYAYAPQGEMQGAIAAWGKFIAGDKRAIRKSGTKELIDIGCPDLILPLNPNIPFKIPFLSEHVANVHLLHIPKAKINRKNQLSLFKSFGEQGLSSKTQSQLRRFTRKLTEAGGKWRLINEFSNEEINEMYIKLHVERWGKLPQAHGNLLNALKLFRKYLFGYVVFAEDEPQTLHLNYWMQNNHYTCVDFINSGLNTNSNHPSIGSVLFYLNLTKATEESNATNTILRYSFGNHDLEYKARWCNPAPLLKV